MRALHMMYDEVIELTKEVREVCLIEELDNMEFCKHIHQKLHKLESQMKEKIKDIWPEAFYKIPSTQDAGVDAIIQNKNDLGR